MLAPRIRAVTSPLDRVLADSQTLIDVLALPVRQDADGIEVLSAHRALVAGWGIDLALVIEHEGVRGAAGEVTRVPWSAPVATPSGPATAPKQTGPQQLVRRVVLVGVGAGKPADYRLAGAALARMARGYQRLVLPLAASGRPVGQALAEGLVLGSYSPPRTGVSDGPRLAVSQVDIVGRVVSADLAIGSQAAGATVLARDLAQTPASTKSPAWMAAAAKRAGSKTGVRVKVRSGSELLRDGFGGLVAVGSAAARGPRLVEMEYFPVPGTETDRHVVLVGKGVTFDTGGISLKPSDSMVGMKTDMTGAGVVLAVVQACAALGVRVRVTGLLPLAENSIGARAYRPGDVITVYGGRTIEVTNTDAEGRLLLADALAYADDRLDPDLMVDVATLTGAATMGLGRGHAAMFSDDAAMVTGLERAAAASGEQIWRMPLVAEYRRYLDSDLADLRQVTSEPGVKAGAIIAALFLREFVGSRRWAHLDIAGPARSERDQGVLCRGGTGFGVRLLLRWLQGLT